MNKLQKRRLKAKLHNKKSKIIIVLIVFFVVLLSSGYALHQSSLTIGGSATIGEAECEYNIFSNFEITNTWGGNDKYHYQVKLTITNNGSEDILDWVLNMVGPSDLDTSWINGTFTNDGGNIEILPLDYNKLIAAGTTLEYSFAVNTVEEELNIESILFNGCLIYGSGSGEEVPLTALAVSPKQASIQIGEIESLSISKTPSYKKIDVTWTSSDTSVATVDSNGNVTGVSQGTTIITASSEGLSDTATITVTEQIITLESITVTPSSYRMTPEEVIPLQITKTPSNADATITWTSSNTSVATVDQNGNVTAVSIGTTTITADAGNNKTSTCQIRVVQEITSDVLSATHEIINGEYTTGTSYMFKITLENLTNDRINYFEIDVGVPEDVSWNLWQNNINISGNHLELQENDWTYIEPNSTFTIQGSITFPEKYLSDGEDQYGQQGKIIPQEYLNPSITIISVE